MDNDEAIKRIRDAAESGRVEFAEELDQSEFEPDFLRDFARQVLGIDWDTIIFVSHMTSCLDFAENRDDVLANLELYYHVDCSEMLDLNLYRVMHKCQYAKM